MASKIFFSWQADTDVGRNFVERALQEALTILKADAEIEEAVREELSLDRDTLGVPGTPPIVETIFNKIDSAAIFVPDLTFVATRIGGKPSPNPNVLIEYGWALKSLGHGCMIPVMNTAYGDPTDRPMPFDMQHLKRPIAYHLSDGATEAERSLARRQLAKDLAGAIRLILQSRPPEPPQEIPVFPAKAPVDGHGRFRAKGEALGYTSGGNPLMPAHEIFLVAGPAVWLRVMPERAVGREWSFDELRRVLGNMALLPVCGHINGGGGLVHVRGEDGLGISPANAITQRTQQVTGVVFVFETGEVWSVDTVLLNFSNEIPIDELRLHESLVSYGDFLWNKLGIQGDLRWIAGLEGVKGRPARLQRMLFPYKNPCAADCVEQEGRFSQGQDPAEALAPFMQKLRSKCGLPS